MGTGIGTSVEQWIRRRRWLVDGVFAAAVAVLTLPISAGVILDSSWPRALRVVTVAALAIGHAAVAVRRTAPRATFGVAGAVMLLLVALPGVEAGGVGPFAPVLVPSVVIFPIALYSVAAWCPRRVARLALALSGAGAALVVARLWGADYLTLTEPGLTDPADPVRSWPLFLVLAVLATVLAPWALGRYRRLRRSYLLELEERARREAEDRRENARRAARDERVRIAREMHDVVAHSLSVMVTQAEGGRLMARKDPAAAVPVLETVARAGQEAMGDMRQLLRALDDHDAAPADAAQPGLDDLAELIDRVRQAGPAVRVTERGERRRLGAAGELAAYRVVQEALTNVLKHAGPEAEASVCLDWQPDALRLTVRNGPGRGPVLAAPGGRGLPGLTERLALLGGTLTAAANGDGGFRVDAVLPARAAGA
ncbi:MAG TPA: histidine kinase [Actinoplanes sp.]|nr:histidine kinase [Actinoplanes sp.]